MTEYVIPILIAFIAILGFSGYVFREMIDSRTRDSARAEMLIAKSMDHVESSHAQLSRKMETWHEDSIRTSNANAERMSELLAVDVNERYATMLAHAKERNDQAVTASAKSTNERLAELNDKRNHTPPVEPREQIKPSRASISRSNADKGMVAERHRGG